MKYNPHNLFQKLRDINILIVSKFLSCIAISVSPRSWKTSTQPFKIVFEEIVPNIKSTVAACVKQVETSLDRLRFCSKKIEKHKSDGHIPSRFVIKADQPLLKFLTHMQIASEIGQQIRLQLLKVSHCY